ncbi:MAG TPA: type III pantothenate kinase [Acidimicrobiales bacterium]|nr:type III pantothenate kinase [Acidimicrobiales bacterium]
MLLAIDVGNTQTVIGVFDDLSSSVDLTGRQPGELPGLGHSWRISTVGDRTADEYAVMVGQLLATAGIVLGAVGGSGAAGARAATPRVIEGVVVSSSVPAVTAALRQMVVAWPAVSLVVVEPGIRTGMPILYDNPREVGADRIVNAVGAVDLFGGPAIVVDFGTATTFDVISARGEYLGGAIAPGLEISMGALFEHAAALRRVELVAPTSVVGRSTVESMQSGAVFGHAALVDGLCRRIFAEFGEAQVIATGGLCAVVAPHTEVVGSVEPWLTLHGLRILYARNIPPDAEDVIR